jgi:hypothetical protein
MKVETDSGGYNRVLPKVPMWSRFAPESFRMRTCSLIYPLGFSVQQGAKRFDFQEQSLLAGRNLIEDLRGANCWFGFQARKQVTGGARFGALDFIETAKQFKYLEKLLARRNAISSSGRVFWQFHEFTSVAHTYKMLPRVLWLANLFFHFRVLQVRDLMVLQLIPYVL